MKGVNKMSRTKVFGFGNLIPFILFNPVKLGFQPYIHVNTLSICNCADRHYFFEKIIF